MDLDDGVPNYVTRKVTRHEVHSGSQVISRLVAFIRIIVCNRWGWGVIQKIIDNNGWRGARKEKERKKEKQTTIQREIQKEHWDREKQTKKDDETE